MFRNFNLPHSWLIYQPAAASPVNTSFLDEDMTSWGEQFSQGDQGGNKKVFYVNGYSCCPTCEGTNFTSETHCAGVRRNGDGYGTEVFTCKDCSWETSFQYDEACKFLPVPGVMGLFLNSFGTSLLSGQLLLRNTRVGDCAYSCGTHYGSHRRAGR